MMFFPEKLTTEDTYELSDYNYVHEELKKVDVEVQLQWNITTVVGNTKQFSSAVQSSTMRMLSTMVLMD